MRKRIKLNFLLLLSTLFAFLIYFLCGGSSIGKAAGKPYSFNGLTESLTIPGVKVTHYSATLKGKPSCEYEDGNGGPDTSSSGVQPSTHTITNPGKIKGRLAVLAAVPREGGTAGVYGCFFALPDAYPDVLFYAGDKYDKKSNGLKKTDISSPCTTIVNKTLKSKLVAYNCNGKKGGNGKRIASQDHEPTPARQSTKGAAAMASSKGEQNVQQRKRTTASAAARNKNRQREQPADEENSDGHWTKRVFSGH